MKKLFISSMMILAIVTSSFATSKSNEPTRIKEYSKIIDSNQVSWKITDQFKKASLLMDGEKTDIFYSNDGRLIGSSKIFAYDKLPKSAIRTISLNYAYPKYSLIECIVFENADQETNYYVSLQKDNEQINLQIKETGTVEEM